MSQTINPIEREENLKQSAKNYARLSLLPDDTLQFIYENIYSEGYYTNISLMNPTRFKSYSRDLKAKFINETIYPEFETIFTIIKEENAKNKFLELFPSDTYETARRKIDTHIKTKNEEITFLNKELELRTRYEKLLRIKKTYENCIGTYQDLEITISPLEEKAKKAKLFFIKNSADAKIAMMIEKASLPEISSEVTIYTNEKRTKNGKKTFYGKIEFWQSLIIDPLHNKDSSDLEELLDLVCEEMDIVNMYLSHREKPEYESLSFQKLEAAKIEKETENVKLESMKGFIRLAASYDARNLKPGVGKRLQDCIHAYSDIILEQVEMFNEQKGAKDGARKMIRLTPKNSNPKKD